MTALLDLKENIKKQLNNLATQYSERMLIEYQKFSKLRESMLELRESYEAKLKRSAGTLQDTLEGLELDYKKQLDERKGLMRDLMKEMEDKKVEFIVEVENDRNMVETQIEYEKCLTTECNETQLWRGRAGVLQKKYDTLTKEVDNLLGEVEVLKEEQIKSQKNIAKYISDRDYAINSKEKRIQELLHKNQELDKYKQVLNHKIAELTVQIEPREFQINDKRKHILKMEHGLAGLNQNNAQLELQLKELKDKYISKARINTSGVADLKLGRHRVCVAHECIQNICTELYHVANHINSPNQLKVAVKNLFQRHASDDERGSKLDDAYTIVCTYH
uniref:Uncharacterized protein n=1 Tax=Glossina pallidipes TaxID=7398 RepID=A0A1B0AFA2_GLOPL